MERNTHNLDTADCKFEMGHCESTKSRDPREQRKNKTNWVSNTQSEALSRSGLVRKHENFQISLRNQKKQVSLSMSPS